MTDGLTHSGVPLGGLGTGSVELRSDGRFHEWQIMNNRPWGTGPGVDPGPDAAFFGMQIRGRDMNRSVCLATPPPHAAYLNDPYAMPWLEHAESIDADVKVPFTRLDYRIASSPVGASLEAFSPMIPLDAKNSALPAGIFTFSLRNRTNKPLSISLFAAMKNLTGYDHADRASEMTFGRTGKADRVRYAREKLARRASDNGTMTLGVFGGRGGKTTYAFHLRSRRDIWDPLRDTGMLENVDLGDFAGQLGNMGASRQARLRRGLPFGALCRTVKLPARGAATVTFVLAWHFPNFREADYPPKDCKGRCIGHRYSEWFDDADDVLAYVIGNLATLRSRTAEFVDAYYATTMDRWLLDAIAAQFTTLVKASWWDRKGRFGIWEGLGCCGLQTTDITHYGSFPILQWFPEVQKSQMLLTRDNVEAAGKIPHLMPGTFRCCDVDHRNRIDLIPQFILLVWRDVLWTGDLDYARAMMPTIERAMEFFAAFDTDGDGLPNNTGPDQTYDQFPLKGTSAFVGFLYAASLAATAELGDLLGRADYAADLRNKLDDALSKLDEQLWTGEYYRLCHDPADGSSNDGVMADQINGDWFLRQTTGEGLLPDVRVRSALRSVLNHCTDAAGFIANCAWPDGGTVEIGRHTADQANWPWSGVEYALAAHLVLMGMEKRGLRVARDVWDRYERAGLRFNHIECGEHYYRAMSSWAVYLAMSGFAMSAIDRSLTIRADGEVGRFVLCTPTGWGEVTVRGPGRVEIRVRRGTVAVKSVSLRGANGVRARVSRNGKPVRCRAIAARESVIVRFDRTITLSARTVLRISTRT